MSNKKFIEVDISQSFIDSITKQLIEQKDIEIRNLVQDSKKKSKLISKLEQQIETLNNLKNPNYNDEVLSLINRLNEHIIYFENFIKNIEAMNTIFNIIKNFMNIKRSKYDNDNDIIEKLLYTIEAAKKDINNIITKE